MHVTLVRVGRRRRSAGGGSLRHNEGRKSTLKWPSGEKENSGLYEGRSWESCDVSSPQVTVYGGAPREYQRREGWKSRRRNVFRSLRLENNTQLHLMKPPILKPCFGWCRDRLMRGGDGAQAGAFPAGGSDPEFRRAVFPLRPSVQSFPWVPARTIRHGLETQPDHVAQRDLHAWTRCAASAPWQIRTRDDLRTRVPPHGQKVR